MTTTPVLCWGSHFLAHGFISSAARRTVVRPRSPSFPGWGFTSEGGSVSLMRSLSLRSQGFTKNATR